MMTERLAREGGAEALVSQLHANEGQRLSVPQLDLLKRMLVVEPERRATLSELLKRTFFRPTATVERTQVTMLGLFCCPKGRYWDDGMRRYCEIPRLTLEKEMRSAVQTLPMGERELRPAARFPDDLLKPLGRGDLGACGVSPRVLHFGGHFMKGGILMEDSAGKSYIPQPNEFIETLRECLQVCPRIECIFLNCCNTFQLAAAISQALPQLIVISWATRVLDPAASCFAAGFYTYLGQQCERGDRKGSLVAAYRSAEAAFDKAFLPGDPDVLVELEPGFEGPVYKGHGVHRILPPLESFANGEGSSDS